jgi:hypothetical protein
MSATRNDDVRDLRDILEDIRSQSMDLYSVQRMLEPLFLAAMDADSPLRDQKEELFGGLAALARLSARECSTIGDLVDEAERLDTRGGGR